MIFGVKIQFKVKRYKIATNLHTIPSKGTSNALHKHILTDCELNNNGEKPHVSLVTEKPFAIIYKFMCLQSSECVL